MDSNIPFLKQRQTTYSRAKISQYAISKLESGETTLKNHFFQIFFSHRLDRSK